MIYQICSLAFVFFVSQSAFAQTGGGTSVGKTFFVSLEPFEWTESRICEDLVAQKTGIDPYSVEYYLKTSHCSADPSEYQQSDASPETDSKI